MSIVTLEDTLNYVSLSNVTPSPDGNSVLYTTHRPRMETNDYEHLLWLQSPKGNQSVGSAPGSLLWTDNAHGWLTRPASKYETELLRFAVQEDGTPTETSQAILPGKVTVLEQAGDHGLLLLADVNILLQARIEGLSAQERQQVYHEWDVQEEDCIIADEFPYWYNGKGVINRYRTQLYLYHPDTGLRRLTEPAFTVQHAAYDAEGETVYFVGASFEVERLLTQKLYRMSLEPGTEAQPVTQTDAYSVGNIADFGISGAGVYYAGKRWLQHQELYLRSFEGQTVETMDFNRSL